MKKLKTLFFFSLIGLLVISCQKDALEPDPMEMGQTQEFVVPDIPDEIASMMSSEDIALFRSGPGEEYLERQQLSNTRRASGHWYPVLMKLGYHLQIGPIGGTSCLPGEFEFCITPAGPDMECLQNIVGAAGKTYADGYWFRKPVHSEYYPVFCGSDYAGYGSGFYQLDNGLLWLEAQNGPFRIDEEGNSTFVRKGNYVADKSSGVFSGAIGWEIMISYTAYENSPSNSPTGTGYTDVIIFGWVYR